jgi:uncharacterized protein YqfA (UPF0365 family)
MTKAEYMKSVMDALDSGSADALSLEDYVEAMEEISSDTEMRWQAAKEDLKRKQDGDE